MQEADIAKSQLHESSTPRDPEDRPTPEDDERAMREKNHDKTLADSFRPATRRPAFLIRQGKRIEPVAERTQKEAAYELVVRNVCVYLRCAYHVSGWREY